MNPSGKFDKTEKGAFEPGGTLSTPTKRMMRPPTDFLLPAERKYPYKVNGKISCDLLRAAMSRAGQNKKAAVAAQAKAMFDQHCGA